MSLITIIIAIVALGIILWLINSYVPLDPMVKKILNIVVIVVLVIWLMKVSGLWSSLSAVHT